MPETIGVFFTNVTGAIFRIELEKADADDLIARFAANYSRCAGQNGVDLTYRGLPAGFELIR